MIFEMVMGIPASGKTQYAKQRQMDDWVRITEEDVRAELKKSFPKVRRSEVHLEMIQRAKEALGNKQHVIYDGCNLTVTERTAILNQIKEIFGKTVSYYIVYMDTNIDLCIKRNNLRLPKVLTDSIVNDAVFLEKPTYKEGWDLIKTIHTITD